MLLYLTSLDFPDVPKQKEKRNKPILADFAPEDARILKLAKPYALASLLSRGIFKYLPTDAGRKLKDEEYVYKDAWIVARREAGMNQRYRAIFGKWVSHFVLAYNAGFSFH
jgi:hypothetical protein